MRGVTRDDPVKAHACFELFQRVMAGDEEVATFDVILHEVLYMLTSRVLYGLSHQDAAARLRPIVALRGLRLAHRRASLSALGLFATYTRLDFGDALAVAQMAHQGIPEILSYDGDFDRVPDVRRIEP